MSTCFTRDGNTLVSLGEDKTIRYWNVAEGKEFVKVPAPAMKGVTILKGNLASLASLPQREKSGGCLARSFDPAARCHGLQELQPTHFRGMAHRPGFFTGWHHPGHPLRALSFVPGTWRLARKSRWLNEPRNPILALDLASDGKTIAVADDQQRVRLTDLTTGKTLFHGNLSCRGGLAFAPDGKQLAVAAAGKTIAFWKVAQLRAATQRFLR